MKDLRLAMPSTNASDDNNNTDFEMPEDQNTGDCKGTQDTSPRNWCSVPVDDDQSLAYTSAQNEINPNTGWKSAPVLLFDSKCSINCCYLKPRGGQSLENLEFFKY